MQRVERTEQRVPEVARDVLDRAIEGHQVKIADDGTSLGQDLAAHPPCRRRISTRPSSLVTTGCSRRSSSHSSNASVSSSRRTSFISAEESFRLGIRLRHGADGVDELARLCHSTCASLATRPAADTSPTRRSVQALRAQPLENARLPDALTQVAGAWTQMHGVPVEASTTGAPRPLPVDVEATLLRTAQEALANVAKHASATRVGLTLSYMDDLVTPDIRDDGVGGATLGGGFGVLGMRERLHGLHGTLAIESESGAGTALSASVRA
jgi:hypothetical protein